MRVLVLLSALACATAAPSGAFLPVSPVAVPVFPAPTISAGDIQAATIDAKVFVEDQARAIADKAKENAEQVIEDQNEKVIEATDIAKEKSGEAFWAVEEKKWQTFDAIKTAEAQLDGAAASNAGAIAKSAIGGIIVPQYITPLAAISPPLVPFVYTPGIIAPKTAVPVVPEIKLEEKDKTDGLVKTAEPEKPKEAVKSAEPEKPELAIQPIISPSPVLFFPPAHNTFPVVPAPVLTPIVKTGW